MATVYVKTTNGIFSDVDGKSNGASWVEQLTIEARDDVTGARVPLNPRNVGAYQRNGILPMQLAPMRHWVDGGSWSTVDLADSARLRKVSCADRGNGLLGVELRWGTRYVQDADYTDGVFLPREGVFTPQLIPVAAFRQPDSITYPVNPLSPGTSDVGGTKIDLGGVARKVEVNGGVLTVRSLIDTKAQKKGDVWDDQKDNYLGRLNATSFIGFAKATLRCIAFETEPVQDEYWRLSIAWAYSSIFHLEQRAKSDPNGFVKRDSNGNATEVVWYRDDSRTAEFNSLYAATALGTLLKWRSQHGEYPS